MTILHGSRLIIWRPDAVIFYVPSEASEHNKVNNINGLISKIPGRLIRGSRQVVQIAF